MMIQSIGAISNNTNTNGTVKKPQSAKPSFEGLGVNKAPKTMKALAAAAILGMAAVGMSSCKQPTDPTVIEIPAEEPTTEDPTVEDPEIEDPEIEDPTVEDPEIEDPEIEDPTVEDPEIEDPEIEDPTIETPTVDIANAPIVNAIRELGFGIDVVEVAPVEGLYTPETGDLVDLKFTDYDVDIAMQMQLDREKSTKDNLVYKCVKSWDTLYDEDIDAQDLQDRYFSKMTFDKENHSVSFFYTDDDNTEKRLMTIRIELDENNKASFIYNGIDNAYKDHAQEVDNGEVFKPPGITQYDEIEIQLAK